MAAGQVENEYQNDSCIRDCLVHRTVFSYGWTAPFTVQTGDTEPQVIQEDFFKRYNNEFSQVYWCTLLFWLL